MVNKSKKMARAELTGIGMELAWLDRGVSFETNGIVIWMGWIIKKERD
jgi:hypothetical protein